MSSCSTAATRTRATWVRADRVCGSGFRLVGLCSTCESGRGRGAGKTERGASKRESGSEEESRIERKGCERQFVTPGFDRIASGAFEGAVPLGTHTFRDTWGALERVLEGRDPQKTEVRIYCTSGVRCEILHIYRARVRTHIKKLQTHMYIYFTRTHAHTYTHTHTHHAHTHAHTSRNYAHTHMYIYIIYVYTHTHTPHKHARTRAGAHTHTHT